MLLLLPEMVVMLLLLALMESTKVSRQVQIGRNTQNLSKSRVSLLCTARRFAIHRWKTSPARNERPWMGIRHQRPRCNGRDTENTRSWTCVLGIYRAEMVGRLRSPALGDGFGGLLRWERW